MSNPKPPEGQSGSESALVAAEAQLAPSPGAVRLGVPRHTVTTLQAHQCLDRISCCDRE